MTVLNKARRPEAAPALFRLLSDSAVSRAALGACAFPLVLLDASTASRPVAYCNGAFGRFFGYGEAESVGTSLASLVFKGDEPLLQCLLAEPAAPRALRAWAKDGSVRHVEVAASGVRSVDGALTHWVLGFSDRSEAERLRAELDAARALPRAA